MPGNIVRDTIFSGGGVDPSQPLVMDPGVPIETNKVKAPNDNGVALVDNADNGWEILDGGHLRSADKFIAIGKDSPGCPVNIKMLSSSDAYLFLLENFDEEFPIFILKTVSQRIVQEMYDSAEGLNIKFDPDGDSYFKGGKVGFGTNSPSANADITLEGGVINLKETTTPTNDIGYGKVYTKADNNLYFQDGAGNERQISFV